METLTDSVRKALESAAPERVTASWGHASGINIAGIDPRTGEQYVTMVLASIISGAGATQVMDGWHACGPLCCFGALSSGDTELLEYTYPIIIRRYGLLEDSGGAGMYRGGSGTVWEVEPIDHEMTVVAFGEGREIPTMGAFGAENKLLAPKLGKLVISDGSSEDVYKKNTILTVQAGTKVANFNPGGGGFGIPFARKPNKVLSDYQNGLVSLEAAKIEYGVVIDPDLLTVDNDATAILRQQTS
jgi:N-methylhydantoinase B